MRKRVGQENVSPVTVDFLAMEFERDLQVGDRIGPEHELEGVHRRQYDISSVLTPVTCRLTGLERNLRATQPFHEEGAGPGRWIDHRDEGRRGFDAGWDVEADPIRNLGPARAIGDAEVQPEARSQKFVHTSDDELDHRLWR